MSQGSSIFGTRAPHPQEGPWQPPQNQKKETIRNCRVCSFCSLFHRTQLLSHQAQESVPPHWVRAPASVTAGRSPQLATKHCLTGTYLFSFAAQQIAPNSLEPSEAPLAHYLSALGPSAEPRLSRPGETGRGGMALASAPPFSAGRVRGVLFRGGQSAQSDAVSRLAVCSPTHRHHVLLRR